MLFIHSEGAPLVEDHAARDGEARGAVEALLVDRRVLGVGQVVDAREQDEEERARRRRREGRVGALGRGHREEGERDEGERGVVAGRLCLVRRADRPILDARRGVAEEQALHRRQPGQ